MFIMEATVGSYKTRILPGQHVRIGKTLGRARLFTLDLQPYFWIHLVVGRERI